MEAFYLTLFTLSLALLAWSCTAMIRPALDAKHFDITFDLQAAIQLHSEQNHYLQTRLHSQTEKQDTVTPNSPASLQDCEHAHQLYEEQIRYLESRFQEATNSVNDLQNTCQSYEEDIKCLQASLTEANLQYSSSRTANSSLRAENTRLNSELEAAQYNFMNQKFRSECYASQLRKDGHNLAKLWTP